MVGHARFMAGHRLSSAKIHIYFNNEGQERYFCRRVQVFCFYVWKLEGNNVFLLPKIIVRNKVYTK